MFSGKRKKVYERDGNKCWLCNEDIKCATDRKIGASLDHFVPKKFGGKNSLDNLRLAHKYCNSIREYKFPHTMTFSVEQIENLTNRNSENGGLSKKAMKAVRKAVK